jgi:hypothetical protein
VLVITAQVGTSAVGKGALQEATGEGRTIDHVELFDGMTKYSTRVTSASRPTVVDFVIDRDEAPSFDARTEARAWGIGKSAPFFTKLKMLPEFPKRI